jgi:hypothetical protein
MKNWMKLFRDRPLTALRKLPLAAWIVVAALGALALCLPSKPEAEVSGPTAPSRLDTFIPRGFVLIPIELENYESVDSILGSYGVVDLYLSGDESIRPKRPLVRRIKILRAPQNPSQFAVLVPEKEAPVFFQGSGQFFAAVQNPKEVGTRFESSDSLKPKTYSRRTLVFE